MKNLVSLILLLLVACTSPQGEATERGFMSFLSNFHQLTVAEVIETLGPPFSTSEENNIKFLTYKRSRSATKSNEIIYIYTDQDGNTVTLPIPSRTVPEEFIKKCEWTFTVKDGRVWNWSYKGNDCIAYTGQAT